MSQFYSDSATSLEKQIQVDVKRTSAENLEIVYEIETCAQWIKNNNFQKVCLQFPDFMLSDASEVAQKLEERIQGNVYILGDTSYESCCNDYIAAAHISGNALIHYGPICLSERATNIPYLNIYEKYDINLDEVEKKLGSLLDQKLVFLLDTPYFYCYENFVRKFEKLKVRVEKLSKVVNLGQDEVVIYFGKNDRKLPNIYLHFPCEKLYFYDENSLNVYEENSKILKRRAFLIEKIKDSEIIGLVIGTMAIKNYLEIINRLKKIIEINNKKHYLISVGKPTIAKLANFPELDIYCIITCSNNEIYDSRDFYKPIVTPYDVEMALNSNDELIKFSFDYNNLLENSAPIKRGNEADVSLISGKIRYKSDEISRGSELNQEVALKDPGALTVYGPGCLANRSWKGLESNLGQTGVKVVEEGRKGIAQGYKNETAD